MSNEKSIEGWVVVRGVGTGFAQNITAARHHFRSDEPTSVGGTGTGPTPYDFLLAGLGACTSMTLALYARRKGWALDEVTVRLHHTNAHVQDCVGCETGAPHLSIIDAEIELAGTLDDEQRARLLEMANRCPVHRTLAPAIDIRTRLI